jgi:hypothetical protein
MNEPVDDDEQVAVALPVWMKEEFACAKCIATWTPYMVAVQYALGRFFQICPDSIKRRMCFQAIAGMEAYGGSGLLAAPLHFLAALSI